MTETNETLIKQEVSNFIKIWQELDTDGFFLHLTLR